MGDMADMVNDDSEPDETPDQPPLARNLPDVTCADCGAPMKLKDSRYGRFWSCTRFPACRGGHGAHPDGMPLGTPADKPTKRARIKAHAAFDPLWKGKGAPMQRGEAYVWLTKAMGRTEQIHIGDLTLDECAQVIALCLRKGLGGKD